MTVFRYSLPVLKICSAHNVYYRFSILAVIYRNICSQYIYICIILLRTLSEIIYLYYCNFCKIIVIKKFFFYSFLQKKKIIARQKWSHMVFYMAVVSVCRLYRDMMYDDFPIEACCETCTLHKNPLR